MPFTRRDFLKLVGGSAGGAAVLAACRPDVREFIAQSPVRLPEDLVSGIDNWYATSCRECSAGCGIQVRIVEGRAKKIEGNPAHPINHGKLCARGQAAVQALYHPDRVRRPMKAAGPRGTGSFTEITWDEALDTLTKKLKELQGQAGSVLLLTDPAGGHLGGLVQLFARAYGATHVPYEPMEQGALYAAVKKAFGQDALPDLDLKNTGYLLSFGADFLGPWISQVRHSRGYGEFRQGDRARGYFVQADSRFSMTAASADEWVPVKPGAEGKLALAMAYVIISEGRGDARAASALTGGQGAAALKAFAPELVAGATGVRPDRVRELARAFSDRENQPALAIGGGAAGAHTNGVSSLTAIYALNHLVASVGKPGGVIFNPGPPIQGFAGQGQARLFPRAVGMPYDQWKAHVDGMRSGAVKALLVRNANPVQGSPAALDFPGALQKVGFVASFSSFLDDTTYQADLVLPAHVPLEDWGDVPLDPGPGFEAVGFQQPVVRPFHDTRGFGDILLALAQDLGLQAQLPWTTFRDVLREGAQRLYQLNRGSIRAPTFEAFWNELLRRGGWWDEGRRSTAQVTVPQLLLPGEDARTSGSPGEFPFALAPFASNTLSDGRGAHLPWLQAAPDPISTATWVTWIEINSQVARREGLKEGDIVRVESPAGRSMEAPVYPNPATPEDVIGVPVGQGHKAYGRYAEGRGSNPLSILEPLTDAETGSLAWAATRVRLTPTGRHVRVPKMENAVVPRDFDRVVAQVTPKD